MSDSTYTISEARRAELVSMFGELGVRHSERFRKVANRYPLRVTEAYGGDIERAAADTDEQVAAKVAEWERRQGLVPRDWSAIGASEGRERVTWTPIPADDPDLEETWLWTATALGDSAIVRSLPEKAPHALHDDGERLLWVVSPDVLVLAKVGAERQVFALTDGTWRAELHQGGRLVVTGEVADLDVELAEMIAGFFRPEE